MHLRAPRLHTFHYVPALPADAADKKAGSQAGFSVAPETRYFDALTM